MDGVFADISVSLDGFVAGPTPTLEEPLGRGGERLHEWVFDLATWREVHGLEGGESGPDDDVIEEAVSRAGAVVMGRRMFGGGDGPWGDEPWEGWWGDEPPFHGPVFVVTHHEREPLVKTGTTFTFVTDGIESAVEQARAAAGGKGVAVAGGADTIRQCLGAGLADELQIHLVPVLLGGGTPLFGGLSAAEAEFEIARVIASERVTHLKYRVVRS